MMRNVICLLAAVILPFTLSSSRAQDSVRPYNEAVERARRDAEDAARRAGDATNRYADSYNRMQGSAANYNRMADNLAASTPRMAVKTEFFNNVTSLRTKDAFSRWVDGQKDDWAARYGPRIREFDPYNDTEYSRYYDKNGQLMVRAVQGDYELFKRAHEDGVQSYNRAVDAKEKAEQDYRDAANSYNDLQTANLSATRAAADLDMATRRLNDFLGRQPNSLTTNVDNAIENRVVTNNNAANATGRPPYRVYLRRADLSAGDGIDRGNFVNTPDYTLDSFQKTQEVVQDYLRESSKAPPMFRQGQPIKVLDASGNDVTSQFR